MSVEVTIPTAGESVSSVRIGAWSKAEGDEVHKDDVLVEIESDKASFEVPAPASGVLKEIVCESGAEAKPGDVIAHIADGEVTAKDKDKERADETEEQQAEAPAEDSDTEPETESDTEVGSDADADTDADPDRGAAADADADTDSDSGTREAHATPAARRILRERGIDLDDQGLPDALDKRAALRHVGGQGRGEEAVPMSPLRKTIARRLVEAQQQAAIVTTFNEVDLSAVQSLREQLGEDFERDHQTRLGIMSFFVKAAVEGLKRFPIFNAELRDDDIVYKRFYDIGVAVGTDRGLVVPVLRNAERMSFADIELAIADFGGRARSGDLRREELEGGTFTISNGGVYGSLLSEPLINPPQTGILGMHAIVDRPVAVHGEVVIRPMMYLALSYDHRLADGRDAVQFLDTMRACIETPARILLELAR